MLTTRDAARLLASVRSTNDLSAITHALDFAPPVPLGRRARERFGFGEVPARVRVAAGHGSLRALLIDWTDASALRARIATLCRALPREAPDLFWLVVALDRAAGTLVIAAPGPGGIGASATSALAVELEHVMDSDAETVAALAACAGETDLLVHLRWRETLGRDALTRRFYRDLKRCVQTLATTAAGGRVPDRDRNTIAILHVSRLLFLAFLEAKGWLDRDRSFLRRRFESCCGGRGAHHRLLDPLFFGTLNTPVARRAPAAQALGRVPFLNGGLFTRTPVECRHRALRFTDDALGDVIIGLLGRYRLTARETSAEWSDAAVDPEMLGRAFESLMSAEDRRATGAFYTPRPLIERLTGQALEAALGDPPMTLARLDALRVLDPACGSGAFLVFALEELAARRGAAGDTRDLPARRRHILARSIFGVDVDPTAVWLCQLRLWLSVVVEDETTDPSRLTPLPNLDRNVREGDALAGMAFGDAQLAGDRSLEPLRLRYARASGVRKRTLARTLDRAERARAIAAAQQSLARLAAERRELLTAVRSRDLFRERRAPDAATRHALGSLRVLSRVARAELRRLRDGAALPFSFATHFPEAARDGGFSVVIGNPPWVRPHAMAPTTRAALRARFFVYRRAAWSDGAAAAAAGRGFASQADLSALFTERATQLAAPDGVIALLLPSKLWIALAGGGVRQHLARHAPPLALEEWSGTAGFDAAVYPSSLLARRESAARPTPSAIEVTAHHRIRSKSLAWRIPRASLALDASEGAPWLLLPHDARAAFTLLADAGVALSTSSFGRPLLGVKTGCNEAFVVERTGAGDSQDQASVRSGSIEGTVEHARLRPLVRGAHLRPWTLDREHRRASIIWTHDEHGAPMGALPPGAHQWLRRWRRQLERRVDGRGDRWWSLFRTEAARNDRPRVVWGDIGRSVRALVLEAGDPAVPLNTCYVIRAASSDDAHALVALLNSEVVLAWLSVLAEPARGGYRRFLGWTCARLPVPRHWEDARARLAPIARAAALGEPPAPSELTAAVLHAYGLRHADIAPLLRWHER